MRNFFTSLIFIFSLVFSVNLWAGPVAPIVMELSQPDGTTFSAVARGDEFANWIETLDGHSIIKENNTWYYAGKDSSGKLISTGAPVGSLSADELQLLPLHVMPDKDPESLKPYKTRKIPRGDGPASQDAVSPQAISHTQYVLTILVNYTDISLAYTDANFQSLIYGASNSVKDFYLKSSYNGFTVTAPAETSGTPNDGIIRVSRPVAHPNHGNDFATSRSEASAIVGLADPFINYASYDTNADGNVSADELAIVIILAGYENSYGGANAATPRVYGHKSGFPAVTLDGKTLSPYTMFGEAHAIAADVAGKHISTIGIMCHELGHLMLGLPDLYDTDYSSDGIGDWGVMGGGEWNMTGASLNGYYLIGDSPALMSAWSKVATGFTLPQDINSNQNAVSIAQAATNEVAKRIWIDKYRLNEYFLLENRQKTGFDTPLPGSGLLVWHVDETIGTNSNESHKLVDLEEADGLAQLDNYGNGNGGDAGDPFPGSTGNQTFNNTSNPNTKTYSSASTGIAVSSISNSASTMTANVTTLAGGLGDHVRYDGRVAGTNLGYSVTTVWTGLRTLNNTLNTNFDGVDVYVNDQAGATIDLYYYSGMAGGTPTGLIHSQTGFAAGPGWNRLLLAAPQSFPAGAERGIVLKIVNNSYTFPAAYDNSTASGRSYISSNGVGAFASFCPSFCGDLNQVALLSGSDDTAPTASVITPATTGPTNANSVSFAVTFSEDVVDFNNSNDVTVTHSGTASSGVSITGSGSVYNVNVTGITGNGSFTLKANTASDIKDDAGNALASSVTSAAVSIDNAAPTAASISPSTPNPTSADSASFVVTFSENVLNFNNSNDVIITHNGTASSGLSITGSGSVYTVTVTGITGNGSFTLGANTASGIKDAAGNALASSVTSPDFVIDNTAPVATVISPATTGPTNADIVSFTVTFSENVFNFNDSSDVTVSHSGTASSGLSITGSGSDYTVDVTGITGNGSFTLEANTGSDVTDVAGNAVSSSVTSAAVSIDNVAPTVSISAPSSASTRTGPVSYTITYTDADEVSLANGNVTLNKTNTATGDVSVTGSGVSTRIVTISNISGQGTLGISLDAGSASDTAGNEAIAAGPSTTFSVIFSEVIFENSFETP